MDATDLLTIGEVARRSGFPQSALRYYEREGLVRTTRTSGGQRRYERSVLRRLAFIRAARTVGVGLEEVRAGLDQLPDGRTPNRADWTRLSRSWRGPAGRADRRAGGAARRAGLLHRVRLPVAAALPALQRRRPDGRRRPGRPAAAPDAAPRSGARAVSTPIARRPSRRGSPEVSSRRLGRGRVTVPAWWIRLDRWLALEGLDNVRDVGGLPLRDGGHDPARGAAAQRVAALRHAGRRRASGRRRSGCSWCWTCAPAARWTGTGRPRWPAAGVETVWLSFLAEDGEALPRADDDTRSGAAHLPGLPVASAARTWSRRSAGWRRADAGPALVHCAAGKDRTGVLVALVLDAVGVQRAAVLADYVLSAEQVPALFRRWTTAAGEPMPADLTPHLPRAEVMAAVLARLDAEHGIGRGGWRGRLAAGQRAGRRESLDRLRSRLDRPERPPGYPPVCQGGEQPAPSSRRPRWT